MLFFRLSARNVVSSWHEKVPSHLPVFLPDRGLYFGREAADSLQIATALAGLGALYLEKGRTGKALLYLQEADEYYSTHQDLEFGHRIEALDLIGKVLKAQKRQLWAMVAGGFVFILLLIGFIILLLRSRRLLDRFDAKNTAEMVAKAREAGML